MMPTATPTDAAVVFTFTVDGKYGCLCWCLEADFQKLTKWPFLCPLVWKCRITERFTKKVVNKFKWTGENPSIVLIKKKEHRNLLLSNTKTHLFTGGLVFLIFHLLQLFNSVVFHLWNFTSTSWSYRPVVTERQTGVCRFLYCCCGGSEEVNGSAAPGSR